MHLLPVLNSPQTHPRCTEHHWCFPPAHPALLWAVAISTASPFSHHPALCGHAVFPLKYRPRQWQERNWWQSLLSKRQCICASARWKPCPLPRSGLSWFTWSVSGLPCARTPSGLHTMKGATVPLQWQREGDEGRTGSWRRVARSPGSWRLWPSLGEGRSQAAAARRCCPLLLQLPPQWPCAPRQPSGCQGNMAARRRWQCSRGRRSSGSPGGQRQGPGLGPPHGLPRPAGWGWSGGNGYAGPRALCSRGWGRGRAAAGASTLWHGLVVPSRWPPPWGRSGAHLRGHLSAQGRGAAPGFWSRTGASVWGVHWAALAVPEQGLRTCGNTWDTWSVKIWAISGAQTSAARPPVFIHTVFHGCLLCSLCPMTGRSSSWRPKQSSEAWKWGRSSPTSHKCLQLSLAPHPSWHRKCEGREIRRVATDWHHSHRYFFWTWFSDAQPPRSSCPLM